MNEDVKKKRLNRKSKKLIIVLFFTMAFFVVITYAWFIGLSVAKVNTFEIKISANEGLSLSLDGLNFYDEINLGNTENEILNNVLNAYPGNPNSWLGVNQTKWNAPGSDETTLEAKKTTDLLPVSTNGLIDQNGSVLTLFSKSSMTSTNGGYALTSDRYLNKLDASGTYLPDEQKGYIVFNLFIKNNDNTKYIKNYNMFNDEAIYMSTDSSVKLVQSSEYDGESSGGDGLENSLRIAFMQIGRVDADSSQEDVTSITCATTDKVTGLCNAYSKVTDTEQPDGTYYQKDTDVDKSNFNTFAIWEPNELKHTTDSKDHFRRICKNRNGNGTYSDTICTFNENGYMDTYVVRNGITASNNVDIYDGLNNYYENTSTNATTLLQKMKYYTDSMLKDGDYRDQVFMLAPNSITLVKVYIYLEGQDVDNYDLESVGKAFAINFGFTKDKYEDTEGGNSHIVGDINGDGVFDEQDVDDVKMYYLGTYTPPDTVDIYDVADANMDGSVNQIDYMLIKRYLEGTASSIPLKENHETFPDYNFRKCSKENLVERPGYGTYLECSNMNIRDITGIDTLTIDYADLSHNRIAKVDNGSINIGGLYLSYNNMTIYAPSDSWSVYLDLSHNNITEIGDNVSAGTLDLSYNNLTTYTDSNSEHGYDNINLSHNNLTNFIENYGRMNTDLSYNKFTSINFDNLNTSEINLSHNNISSVSGSVGGTVGLSYNNLDNSILPSLSGASYLDVSHNNITNVDLNDFPGNMINLSYNNITNAIIGGGYDEVNLSNNNLSSVTISSSISHLNYLNLSYNNFTSYTLDRSINIAKLVLSNNNLRSVNLSNASYMNEVYLLNNGYNGCINLTPPSGGIAYIYRDDDIYCH